MKYEQVVVLYGTVIVDADDEDKARDKILKILSEKIYGNNLIKDVDFEFMLGDFERVGKIVKIDEV